MKQSRRVVWFGGAALLVPLVLAGCSSSSGRAAVEVVQAIRQNWDNGQVGSLAPDPQAAGRLLKRPVTQLPVVKNRTGGIGVMVMPPVCDASPEAVAFSAGSGRWLNLQVAGVPRFERSATWYGSDLALRDAGAIKSAPSPEQAFAAGKALALTHVATGKLEGTPQQGTLTYRLWKLPQRQPVGQAVVVRGNREQIARALPGVARTLGGRLGAGDYKFAQRMELRAEELTQLGSLPPVPDRPYEVKQAEMVEALASRSTLAGMYALEHFSSSYTKDDKLLAQRALGNMAQSMASRAGENCMILAQVSAKDAARLTSAPQWQGLAARYPRNYMLAFSLANWHGSRNDRASQRTATRAILEAAPQSALAWLQWDALLMSEADAVRHARYTNEMTSEELAYVNERYPIMVQASLKAVQCDPRNSSAWLRLGKAAAFNGDREIADVAYRQAMSLPGRSWETYYWGLQMYQPKWQGNTPKLRRVAELLSEEKPLFVREFREVLYAFNAARKRSDRMKYEGLAHQMVNEWFREHPDDIAVRSNYADYLFVTGDSAGAAAQFQQLMQLFPQKADGYLGIARQYDRENNWSEAAAFYAKALQRNDVGLTGLFRGGQALHQTGQYDKAEVLYRKAIKLYPEDAESYNRLADLYVFVKNDPKEAERLYRKAIALDPDVELFQQNLQRLLGQ